MSAYNNCVHVETKENDKYKLCVFEFNYGLRGDVFEYNPIKKRYCLIERAKFYHKDKDASVFRVKEYFGF